MSAFRVSTVLCLALLVISTQALLNRRIPRHLSKAPVVEVAADEWFTQVLDHFNPSDIRTWQQRYFTNDTYFSQSETSPIFLLISGESTADPTWLSEMTQIKEYAQRYSALLFMVEHRFYGISKPTENMSTQNLQYLSSQQALADLAYFIQEKNTEYGFTENNKWVVFGGSYPGNLAAFFRMKYPHLAHAAVASSAPVQNTLDYTGYVEVLQQSLDYFSPGCSDVISNATAQMDQLLADDGEGWQTLSTTFQTCTPFNGTDSNDVANFYEALEDTLAGVVQYNLDNRAFEGAIGTDITIDTVCGILQNETRGSAMQRYADVQSLLMETYGETCLDYRYNRMVELYKVVNWYAGLAGARQYLFQSCREWGFFQTTDGPADQQPFGTHFPLSFFTGMCQDVFGEEYNETFSQNCVDWSNTYYGGQDIKVSRIFFPNGSIDPWHRLGILSNTTEGAVAVLMEGTAHCADMYPATPDDLPILTQTRQQISDLIGQWLAED